MEIKAVGIRLVLNEAGMLCDTQISWMVERDFFMAFKIR